MQKSRAFTDLFIYSQHGFPVTFFFLFFLYIPYRKSQRKVLLKKLIYFSDAGRHSYLANFRGAIFEVDSIV